MLADGNSDDDTDVDDSDLAVWKSTYGSGPPAVQSPSAELSPVEAASLPQVVLIDRALSILGKAESRQQKTDEPQQPLATSVPTGAISKSIHLLSYQHATDGADEQAAPVGDDAAAIELQLRDQLISVLF